MSSSRREFLKASGAAAMAACAGTESWGARANLPIGLQLYSVRNLLPRDFDGTLKQPYKMDYRVVEAAGYFNKSSADWNQSMKAAGLRCISSHHILADLKTKLSELIDYGKAIGLEYMICSWAGMHRNPARKGELDLDDWRWVADQFNEIGQKVTAAGIRFGYHNHTIEFKAENRVLYFDELLKRTDPKYVVFEMDCGWVVAAGFNPVEWLSKTPERFPLLHVKDMAKDTGGQWHSVVLGTGVIDYHPIFKAATGLRQYFIEQEEFKGDPLSELHQDARFMRNFSI